MNGDNSYAVGPGRVPPPERWWERYLDMLGRAVTWILMGLAGLVGVVKFAEWLAK